MIEQPAARAASIFSFPNPVNEISARVVAGAVLLMALATLALREPLILIPLAYGFVARVATGPTMSPLGQIVTRLVVPRLPIAPRPVAGPPKRFAQGMGAVITLGAALAHFGFGRTDIAYGLVTLIAAAAFMESVLGLCIGCRIFAILIRLGVIPKEVCERCENIWATKQG